MKISELSEEQKLQLKQRILTERNYQRGEDTSYGELADADDLVSDDDLEDWYGDVDFVPEDFWGNAGADEDGGQP